MHKTTTRSTPIEAACPAAQTSMVDGICPDERVSLSGRTTAVGSRGFGRGREPVSRPVLAAAERAARAGPDRLHF
jgi:hypothetical protein